jgi:hypothetical protein
MTTENIQDSNEDEVIGHHAEGEKSSKTSKKTTSSFILATVVCCVGAVVFTALTIRSRQGGTKAGTALQVVAGGGRQRVPGQDVCRTLPFTEPGVPVSIESLSFAHAGTVKYYGLSGPDWGCCTSERQLLCTDGNTLVFGQNVSGKYAVAARTRHCVDSTLRPAFPATSTWGDDIVNSDLLEGFVESPLYLLREFGLNCSTDGPILDQDVCSRLPFTEPGVPVSIESLSAGTREHYGLFDPAWVCCASERQVLCTDGYALVFGQNVSGIYAVAAETRHCINSTLLPAFQPATTMGDDMINKDLLEGLVTDQLYVLREFGLNCSTAGPIVD